MHRFYVFLKFVIFWGIKSKTKNRQAYHRAATDRQPYEMGVLKIEIALTRSNFAVHIFDFDILCILLGTTYMRISKSHVQ